MGGGVGGLVIATRVFGFRIPPGVEFRIPVLGLRGLRV